MSPVWRMAAIWNCPQTPDGNIRRQSQMLLGQWNKTSWNVIGSHCQGVGKVTQIEEQRMMSCGGVGESSLTHSNTNFLRKK